MSCGRYSELSWYSFQKLFAYSIHPIEHIRILAGLEMSTSNTTLSVPHTPLLRLPFLLLVYYFLCLKNPFLLFCWSNSYTSSRVQIKIIKTSYWRLDRNIIYRSTCSLLWALKSLCQCVPSLLPCELTDNKNHVLFIFIPETIPGV